jgi:hypothetical protein
MRDFDPLEAVEPNKKYSLQKAASKATKLSMKADSFTQSTKI